MDPVLMIVALLVLLIAWGFVRMRKKTSPARPATTRSPRSRNTAFHAVSIKLPKNACAAARSLAERRFLATAAPRLPLPECDVLECHCRFNHHQDRRARKDRRSPFATAATPDGTGRFEKERRDTEDRRNDDFEL